MEKEEVYAATREDLHGWLKAHHGTSPGIWLIYDKGAARQLSYDDIVEEALSFGWIDSLPRARSDTQAMLHLAPRRPKSAWSRRNKERVEQLTAAGRMQAAGLAVVAAAKASGTWSAIDEVEALVEPPDLQQALDGDEAARSFWDAFPRSTKRAILEWVASAKRPETRAARIQTTVEEAAENRRANQWRQPGRR